jgi:hypothetical protein
MIVVATEAATSLQVTLQSGLCTRMQREQVTFTKLGVTNQQTVRGDIFEAQRQGFRDTHPGHRQ